MIDFDGVLNAALKSTLAEDVTYTPYGGSPVVVRGIFQDSIPGESFRVLDVFEEDFAGAPKGGDIVVVRSVSYRVVGDPRNDVGGVVKLALEKV